MPPQSATALAGCCSWAHSVPGRMHDTRALCTEGIRDPLQRYSKVKAQVDAGSAGCAGGGVGRAERVPQAGEVNGTPCVRGHMV